MMASPVSHVACGWAPGEGQSVCPSHMHGMIGKAASPDMLAPASGALTCPRLGVALTAPVILNLGG